MAVVSMNCCWHWIGRCRKNTRWVVVKMLDQIQLQAYPQLLKLTGLLIGVRPTHRLLVMVKVEGVLCRLLEMLEEWKRPFYTKNRNICHLLQVAFGLQPLVQVSLEVTTMLNWGINYDKSSKLQPLLQPHNCVIMIGMLGNQRVAIQRIAAFPWSRNQRSPPSLLTSHKRESMGKQEGCKLPPAPPHFQLFLPSMAR